MRKTEIVNRQSRIKLKRHNLKKLTRILTSALEIEGSISLVIVDANEIQSINRKFLNINQPTNVISFKYDSPELFGEIILSADAALSEAKFFKHSEQEHLAYLVLHGLLHLAGYHHESKGQSKKALRLQDELFSSKVAPFVKENPIF